MSNIYVVSKKPDALNDIETDAVVKLHQQFFDLRAEDIIGYLKERTYVDLFYEKETKQLIGTVGIQWYFCDDTVIVYLGNAVIDKKTHGHGLLTRSVLRSVCKTSFKFPFKRKFLLGFATSPKAYSYFTKYKYSWPKPFEEVPPDINEVIGKFLNKYYPQNYKTHEHGYIIIPKEANVRAKSKNQVLTRYQDSWFTCSNISFDEGYQLPCIASINATNYWVLIKSVLNVPKKSAIKRALVRCKQYMFRFKDQLYLASMAILIFLLYSDYY
ncbi:MAG: hypothetical protein M1486_04335 [Gammaproteobacteria bacterium]|nr:hypothetical protein [Gammaproteobacteria bacterium]